MAYTISGTYLAACSCMNICPCPVDQTPTDPNGKGECRGYAVFAIREGNLGGTDLGGVKFALYNLFPSNLTAGNWNLGVIVDEGASEEQAQALERILSGQEGGPFADLSALVGQYDGMERAGLTLSDGETPSMSIAGRAEFSFEPHRALDGSAVTVKGAPFAFAPEYQIGKASGRGDIYGGFDARYGEYSEKFSFSSEGAPEVRGRG